MWRLVGVVWLVFYFNVWHPGETDSPYCYWNFSYLDLGLGLNTANVRHQQLLPNLVPKVFSISKHTDASKDRETFVTGHWLDIRVRFTLIFPGANMADF